MSTKAAPPMQLPTTPGSPAAAEELRGLRMSELLERMPAAGVAQASIDGCFDAPSPKDAAVELLLAAAEPASAEPASGEAGAKDPAMLKPVDSNLTQAWEGSWLGSINMVCTGYLAIGARALRSCVIPNKRTNLRQHWVHFGFP